MHFDGLFIGYNSADSDPDNKVLARSDYAANVGDTWPYAGGLSGGNIMPPHPQGPHDNDIVNQFNGISFVQSMVPIASILDGTSNTYMVGEKYLNPDHYETGASGDDNEHWSSGYNNDHYRSGLYPPVRDTRGLNLSGSGIFGGIHSSGVQFVLCDGSVHNVAFTIDESVHSYLANRKDGEVVPHDSL